MTVRRRRSDRSGRSKLHSPGRPDSARREELVRFWAAIATGRSSEDAARDAGVSPPVASATLMTMLWPRPSMVFTKPRSFTGAGRGAHSGPSSSLLWNGWIGPITGGSWSPSETSRRPKPRNATTPCWSSQIWRRDSNKMASAKPGAVQTAPPCGDMLGHTRPPNPLRRGLWFWGNFLCRPASTPLSCCPWRPRHCPRTPKGCFGAMCRPPKSQY